MDTSGAEGGVTTPRSWLILWAKVIFAFLVAIGIQIFFYGAPALFGFGSYHVSGGLYLLVVLVLIFGPAIAALLFSWRQVFAFYHQTSKFALTLALVAAVLFALMSAYAGIFVSCNTWGT